MRNQYLPPLFSTFLHITKDLFLVCIPVFINLLCVNLIINIIILIIIEIVSGMYFVPSSYFFYAKLIEIALSHHKTCSSVDVWHIVRLLLITIYIMYMCV